MTFKLFFPFLLFSSISFSLLFFTGCGSKYEVKVQQELAKGVRYDSLFLGLYLGMPRQAFFDHCTQLNKQKLITTGVAGMVEYKITELDNLVIMHFYPDFANGKISSMKAEYSYQAWAPWNKEYFSDKLLTKLLTLLEKKYSAGFFKLEETEQGSVFVKIDGNRQITIAPKDETIVQVLFTDLTNKPKAAGSEEK